jgi:HlyD family secretion protein
VIVAVVVLAAAAAVVWWVVAQSQSGQQSAPLAGSGIIEVTQVPVGSPSSAQIVAVYPNEGQQIEKGALVARLDGSALRHQADAANAAVQSADAAVRAARAGVQAAYAQKDAACDSGDDATIDKADAEVKQAKAQVDQAKAQANQARSQLAIARAQASQARVTSPLDGVVFDVPVNAGEQASAGQTLVTVGDLARPKLVIYVPEPLMGRVKIGQKAVVTVDGVPGRTFDAVVSQVAEQAEFTPTAVETKDQRTKLVFGVTLEMANPGLVLKPGMPADATLE